jgi:hypothetical protein
MFWTLVGYIPSLEDIVPLDIKRVAMRLRRKGPRLHTLAHGEDVLGL